MFLYHLAIPEKVRGLLCAKNLYIQHLKLVLLNTAYRKKTKSVIGDDDILRDKKGISPIVGVILVVAMTVLLAAIAWTYMSRLATSH